MLDGSQVAIYAKSMGKVFRVRHIARTVEEANAFCVSHDDCAVIAWDEKRDLSFIAEKYALTVASDCLPN
jgi:hypothetical protein